MSRKTLSPASVFERVLRAHETGGVTFKDVRAQLKELLAAGASPADLLETLRRQEQWEPLPESARVEVVGLIDEAIRTAPKNDDSAAATPTAGEPTPSGISGDSGAANGLQSVDSDLPLDQRGFADNLTQSSKVRRPAPSENVRTLEARIAGQQADYTTLTRSYERAREAESIANARASALAVQVAALEASRDANHAKAQQSAVTLAETLAANEALHARAESAVREASDARSELRALGDLVRARDAALVEAQELLRADAAELAALQQQGAQAASLLAAEQARSQHDAKAIVELKQSDKQREAEVSELRRSLTARDTATAEMQNSMNARVKELESLLQAERSTRDEAQRSGSEQEARRDTELQALRAALAAEQAKAQHGAELAEQFQEDVRGLRNALSARDEALTEARRSGSEQEARRDTELQTLRAALAAEQAKTQHAAELAEQFQEDVRGLRNALSARDAAIAEMQNSMNARVKELEALLQAARSARDEARRSDSEREAERNRELQELRDALSTRDRAFEALQSDLQTARSSLAQAQRSGTELDVGRDTELEALRAALVAEQTKSQHAAQAAEQVQGNIRSLRESLSARDASLAEAQRSLGTRAAGLEALQSDLQSARSTLAEAQRSLSERDALIKEHAAESQSLIIELANVRAASTSQLERLPLLKPISAEPTTVAARVASPNRVVVVAAIGIILLGIVAAYFLSHRAPPTAPVAVSVAPALSKPGTVIRDCLTCPEITVLPTGMFSQGSAGPGVGPAAFEKPLHVVTISSAIGMATNLVTVDDFQQFVTASGWQSQGCTTYDGEWKARPKSNWSNPGFTQTGKHPVTCASWNDAQAYAKWLSAKAGHTYRLPSASEWEYAARAGGEGVAPWTAESAACANANVADNSAARRYPGWAAFNCDDGYVYTSPVGSFKSNAFGLNDMLGNVFQWTEDCWHPDYVGAPSDGTARTDGPCDEHELRGGSWFTTPAYVRANYRNHFTADYRSSTVGIRLVRDLGA